MAALTKEAYDWRLLARPTQLAPPGEWFIWMYRGGRGAGKTRTGAEYVRSRIDTGEWRTVNIVGSTVGDTIDVMIRGRPEAPGLLGVWPPHQMPQHQVGNRQLVCHNGAVIRYRGADEPERFRGPQADGGWCDEIDSWKPKGMKSEEAFYLFELGIRLGVDPRIIVTSTPRRARLVKMLQERDDCVETHDSTFANRANLSPRFFDHVVSRNKGTHLWHQEILGEVLPEIQGAILAPEMIAAYRVHESPPLQRVSVGVDPSGSTYGDRQGIVAVGLGEDGHGYVLADNSCTLKPEGWGRRAVQTALAYGTDRVVVETNYGGDMAVSTITAAARLMDVKIRVDTVNASRGKHVRFDPVSLLYEQGQIHHVGHFTDLEKNLCSFTVKGYEGDDSPDAADALVWAVTDLMLEHEQELWVA